MGYAGCTPERILSCFVGCSHERIYYALWVVPMRGFIMLCVLFTLKDSCFVGCAHERISYALWVAPMRGYIILCGLRFSEAMVSWTLSGHRRQVS